MSLRKEGPMTEFFNVFRNLVFEWLGGATDEEVSVILAVVRSELRKRGLPLPCETHDRAGQ
jgi:hypothetical protein